MNRKDLQGFGNIIKEDNVIIKISKGKGNVRKVCFNFEDGEDLIVTGYTLSNAIKNASLALKGEQINLCVQGKEANDSELDKLLDNYNIILSRFQNSTEYNCLSVFSKKTKDQPAKNVIQFTESSNRNIYALFEHAELVASVYTDNKHLEN